MIYSKSDATLRNQTLRPIPAPGIGRRISAALNLLGTRKYASEVMDVSGDALQRYMREENKPTFEALARLCLATGVSMEWLATGDGEMLIGARETASDKESQRARFDREILREAVKLLRAIYLLEDATYDVAEDPELLIETYDFLAKHGGRASPAEVIDFGKYLADRRRAKEKGNADRQGASGTGAGGAGAGKSTGGGTTGQGSW